MNITNIVINTFHAIIAHIVTAANQVEMLKHLGEKIHDS